MKIKENFQNLAKIGGKCWELKLASSSKGNVAAAQNRRRMSTTEVVEVSGSGSRMSWLVTWPQMTRRPFSPGNKRQTNRRPKQQQREKVSSKYQRNAYEMKAIQSVTPRPNGGNRRLICISNFLARHRFIHEIWFQFSSQAIRQISPFFLSFTS